MKNFGQNIEVMAPGNKVDANNTFNVLESARDSSLVKVLVAGTAIFVAKEALDLIEQANAQQVEDKQVITMGITITPEAWAEYAAQHAADGGFTQDKLKATTAAQDVYQQIEDYYAKQDATYDARLNETPMQAYGHARFNYETGLGDNGALTGYEVMARNGIFLQPLDEETPYGTEHRLRLSVGGQNLATIKLKPRDLVSVYNAEGRYEVLPGEGKPLLIIRVQAEGGTGETSEMIVIFEDKFTRSGRVTALTHKVGTDPVLDDLFKQYGQLVDQIQVADENIKKYEQGQNVEEAENAVNSYKKPAAENQLNSFKPKN